MVYWMSSELKTGGLVRHLKRWTPPVLGNPETTPNLSRTRLAFFSEEMNSEGL